MEIFITTVQFFAAFAISFYLIKFALDVKDNINDLK